jgi:hypothetical protein
MTGGVDDGVGPADDGPRTVSDGVEALRGVEDPQPLSSAMTTPAAAAAMTLVCILTFLGVDAPVPARTRHGRI